MVEHDIHAQRLHHLVKALGREALEERVGLALAAHAVNDLIALVIIVHHLVNGVDIVLQVRVHRDNHIRIVHSGQQARQQRVLMAAVAGEVHAGKHLRLLLVQLADNRPGVVAGAVVDKHHAAPAADFALVHQLMHLFAQALARLGQHLLLFIARYDNVKRVFLVHR